MRLFVYSVDGKRCIGTGDVDPEAVHSAGAGHAADLHFDLGEVPFSWHFSFDVNAHTLTIPSGFGVCVVADGGNRGSVITGSTSLDVGAIYELCRVDMRGGIIGSVIRFLFFSGDVGVSDFSYGYDVGESGFTFGAKSFNGAAQLKLPFDGVWHGVVKVVKKNGVCRAGLNVTGDVGVLINGVPVVLAGAVALHDLDRVDVGGFSFIYRSGSVIVSERYVDLIQQHGFRVSYRVTPTIPGVVCDYSADDSVLSFNPPSAPPEEKPGNLIMTLLPAVAGLALMVVVRGFMNKTGNMTMLIYSGGMMVMGLGTSVAKFIMDRKKAKKDATHRVESYISYLGAVENDIKTYREQELRTLSAGHPMLSELIQGVCSGNSSRLFLGHCGPDGFDVVMSRGDYISPNRVKCDELREAVITWGHDDELCAKAQELIDREGMIPNAPLVMKLSWAVTGVVGEVESRVDAFKRILCYLAMRIAPTDSVRYWLFLSEDVVAAHPELREFRWLSQVSAGGIYCGAAEISRGLINFETVVGDPSVEDVCFVWDCNDILSSGLFDILWERGELSCSADRMASMHLSVVTFGGALADIPCGARFILDGDTYYARDCVRSSVSGVRETDLGVFRSDFTRFIQILLAYTVPVRVTQTGSLNTNLTYYELRGVFDAHDVDVRQLWDKGRATVTKTMAIPVGLDSMGGVVTLDISDKGAGPHGLVAGTTGSGKSEFVLSVLLGLLLQYSPLELGLIVVDFKGGGMSARLRGFPHLLGELTNLDGRMIARAQEMLGAELKRRERLLMEAGVSDIHGYLAKGLQMRGADYAMGHLLIVVDEFAELKSECPDFMDYIVSVARVGRTLGFHLILSTQRPSGVMTGQIASNVTYTACLKVVSEADSREIIGSDVAASLKTPGTVYLREGSGPCRLFQSGYTGADASRASVVGDYDVDVREGSSFVRLWRAAESVSSGVTQLDALAGYVHEVYETSKEAQIGVRGVLLPQLPDAIPYGASEYGSERTKVGTGNLDVVHVGYFDAPGECMQGAVDLDICNHTLMLGPAGCGNTTFLLSMAAWWLLHGRGYGLGVIDCGVGSFGGFRGKLGVFDVLTAGEGGRDDITFANALSDLVDSRRAQLRSGGYSDYLAFNKQSGEVMAPILLLVDGIELVSETFPVVVDALNSVLRYGRTLGIFVIATAHGLRGLTSMQKGSFGVRGLYTCIDSSFYGEWMLLAKGCYLPVRPGAVRFVDTSGAVVDCQLSLCEGLAVGDDLRGHLSSLLDSYTGVGQIHVPMVDHVPDVLYLDTLRGKLDAGKLLLGQYLEGGSLMYYRDGALGGVLCLVGAPVAFVAALVQQMSGMRDAHMYLATDVLSECGALLGGLGDRLHSEDPLSPGKAAVVDDFISDDLSGARVCLLDKSVLASFEDLKGLEKAVKAGGMLILLSNDTRPSGGVSTFLRAVGDSVFYISFADPYRQLFIQGFTPRKVGFVAGDCFAWYDGCFDLLRCVSLDVAG